MFCKSIAYIEKSYFVIYEAESTTRSTAMSLLHLSFINHADTHFHCLRKKEWNDRHITGVKLNEQQTESHLYIFLSQYIRINLCEKLKQPFKSLTQ